LLKKLFKHIFRFLLAILLLLVLLILLLQLPWVQNRLVDSISSELSKSIGSEVSVGNVSIDFLSRLHINNVLIRDYKKDTLIYVGSLSNKHLLDFSIDQPLQFIGQKLTLSDVKFYLDNTIQDSVFNVTKTFRKSPPKIKNTSTAAAPKGKSISNLLRFGKLNLNNVNFRLRDKYNYQTISFHLQELDLDANQLKFSDSVWKLGNLDLDKPTVSIVHHPAPYIPKSYKPEYLKLPFQLHLDRLNLSNAKLRITNEKSPNGPTGQLTFSDLDVRNVFLLAEDVELRQRSIQGKVRHLRAIEKSGLGITDLKTNFFMNSYRMEAKGLNFKTNNSNIKGYLRFNYKHMREYLRFAAWVNVIGDVNGSNISLKDLAYFAPTLKSWKHLDVKFNTIARGTMNDLNLLNLNGSLNENKIKFNGKMRVMDMFSDKGLNTLAQLKNFSFDKKDIEFVFQKKDLPAEIDRLGVMTYDGEFKGNPTNFTLNGELLSSKGKSILKETSFNFTKPQSPKYKGDIQLLDIHLSEILAGSSPIDHLSAKVFVDGEGFDVNSLNSYIKGDVSSATINDRVYSNFQVDGKLQDKVFHGEIRSLDPSLSFNANGKISMKEVIPDLELQVNLENIDLQKLGYTKKKLHLYANLYGIGRGKNLDEMLGTMNIKDMFIIDRTKDNKMYGFSNITIEKDIFEESGNKYLQINSEEINASLVGEYRVSDLTGLLKDYFISYLAINKSQVNKRSYESSYFNLSLEVKNIRNYSLVLHPELKNIGRGKLNARFNGLENKMTIEGEFNQTEYLGFKFPFIKLSNLSSNTNFKSTLNIDSVYFDNKLAITPFMATLSQGTDGLDLAVELLNRTDDKFVDFNCSIKKDSNDYYFHLKPFNSYLGRKVWSVHPDNLVRLNMDEKILQVENLELLKDIQSIKFDNQSEDFNSLMVKFEEVKLEELISGFLPILKTFKGKLNGTIEVSDLLTHPKPVANISIGKMMWDNEDIGGLTLTSDLKDEIVHSDFSIYGDSYRLYSEVFYNSKAGVDSLYSVHQIERFKPNILNKILGDLVYEMDGNLHGELQIFGPLNALNANGKIVVDSLKTGIHTIYTKYSANRQTIEIIPGKFIFNQFKFYDEEGNEGTASGFINYNNLKKYDLFLDASSSKLLCMNSTSSNNSTIYGKVYADADIKFRGTIGDRISILSKGRNLANSILHINLETIQKSGKYGFYEFVAKDTFQKKSNQLIAGRSKKLGGVNLDFEFDITRDGKLFIIMDPSVEDRIECSGQGRIAFKMTPETETDIKGSYEIFSGTYLFTYQNLIQRLFYLNKGGTMTFVGDPRASLIDASATFTTRASAQELISAYFGSTDNSRIISAAKSNVKTNIILKLKNRIAQPDISYELKVDQNNPEVQIAFEAIESTTRNNEAEMNKQVIGLLMFKRFFPPTFTGFSQNQNPNNAVQSDIQNTLSDVVTGRLSGYISDWMQNTFKGMNFGLSYKNYSQLSQDESLSNTRNELKIAISQRLLNDRLVFNLGGNYDFGRGQFNNTNTAFFGGDMDIEYLLTPLGNVRAKFYSTLSNDPLNSVYINKTGVGILIQKDFDEFNQLFKKNRLK
jgi:hypothetical protein